MTTALTMAAQTACDEIGIIFRQVPADGHFHPLDVKDKPLRNGAGRIRLYPDGEGGQVWNHVYDTTRQFWANQEHTLTPAEFAGRARRAAEERQKAERELAEARQKAAKLANQIWQVSSPPVSNPYLLRKQVQATESLREIPLDSLVDILGYHPKFKGEAITGDRVLIVPVRSEAQLTTVEMIDNAGRKPALVDGQKKGCFWATGSLPDGKGAGVQIGIGEGVATMLSYHMASGNLGIATLSCGNLRPVAEYFRRTFPEAQIIILADLGNGQEKAIEAAHCSGSLLVVPSLRDDSAGTDINDVHVEMGLAEVKNQLESAAVPLLSSAGKFSPDADLQSLEPEWAEPLPLPDGLSPVKPLSPDMIPLSLRRWLMDISDRMQIPPDFSTAAALVALGSIVGRGCGMHPKRHDDWIVVPNIWGGVVGRPSLMKTPAVTEALKHLSKLESEAREEYQIAMRAFEFQKEVIKATRSAVADELKKAVKAGKPTDAARAKLEVLQMDEPARRRYQTQDSTTEKIGELLNQNPRGILVNRDELIGWFRSLERDGRESDRAFYLEAWNGTRGFTYDRIGRGTLDISALSVSVFGAITPGPLSEYVYQAQRGGNGDDGLLQRFQMFVWPDSPRDWVNVDRFPDSNEKNRVWEIFKILSGEIPGALKEEGGEIPALRFSVCAQEIFDSWRHLLEMRLRSDHGLSPAMESHLAKYRSLMPALALIFHLVDTADGIAPPGPVSEKAAILASVWCEYLESHAKRIYGAATMPGLESAREILKHIKRGEIRDGDTLRSIYRGREWSKLTCAEEVKAGLQVLQEYDWLIVEKSPTGDRGGRPSEKIQLNPRIRI